jgi:tight adherence protein B
VSRRSTESDLEQVAALVQRLGVLLAAGVAPASAWNYLAEVDGPQQSRLQAVTRAIGTGAPLWEAIASALHDEDLRGSDPQRAAAWQGLAAAWFVATDAGAPLAGCLQDFARSLRNLAQTSRDLRTALAGPVATARMVLLMPLVGVLFGIVLGFNTVGTLVGTPGGLVCLTAGAVLLVAARWWSRRLLAAARPKHLTPGLVLDLTAIAVSGGASLARSVQLVDAARKRCGIQDDGTDAVIAEVLALSRRAGVPAAVLLRSEAEELRRQARSAGEQRAATLAVTLMLPLGLCILPAFMLLGVAPLLISIVSSTAGVL